MLRILEIYQSCTSELTISTDLKLGAGSRYRTELFKFGRLVCIRKHLTRKIRAKIYNAGPDLRDLRNDIHVQGMPFYLMLQLLPCT